jgi:maltooligosyltrehalose trehalohydrolase
MNVFEPASPLTDPAMIAGSHFGPLITPNNVIFRLWAPSARRVELVTDRPYEMRSDDRGWHSLIVPGAGPGDRYRFRIDDDIDVPDPASRFQPEDVHGRSEIIDPVFDWQAQGWIGRPWHECIFLEIHVGTFSKEGTFRGAIEKLDHVAATGFTAIELMPVADFFGRRNWGYDGVLPYAPDSTYGRPEDLKALVDAAHQLGLMVFLDVVHNHFGPEGNYLSRYASQFFIEADTPWGSAIDYQRPEVRRFAVENAIYWLDEFRLDGLRLDAVHAIVEPGRTLLLRDLSVAAGRTTTETGRNIHLVVENDDNQSSLLDPMTDPPRGKYRAQWNDDYHHAFHVILTGETGGYYGDYADARPQLARALAEGFVYQGEASLHRNGAARGQSTSSLPAIAFVNFLQNHDQIGNRALGERLSALAPAPALEAALAVTLLAPAAPLMFMGDEWGSLEPFPFFCDFRGRLADAVRDGRHREFADVYARYKDNIPDPLLERTFRLAKLDWTALDKPEHSARLDFVRRLLTARKEFVIPRLPDLYQGFGRCDLAGETHVARWPLRNGETLVICANLGETPQPLPDMKPHGDPFWGGAPPNRLPPWSVYAAIEAP